MTDDVTASRSGDVDAHQYLIDRTIDADSDQIVDHDPIVDVGHTEARDLVVDIVHRVRHDAIIS